MTFLRFIWCPYAKNDNLKKKEKDRAVSLSNTPTIVISYSKALAIKFSVRYKKSPKASVRYFSPRPCCRTEIDTLGKFVELDFYSWIFIIHTFSHVEALVRKIETGR